MPNLIAYLVLLSWPLVMVVLFKKLSPDQALTWSFLGAFMVIPPEVYVDFPLVPTLNKYTLPSIAALILCLTMVDQKLRFFPKSYFISMLMIVFVLSPFFTVMTNLEPVIWGIVFLPGLSMRDAVSEVMGHAIIMIPFILGFNFLRTTQSRRSFLFAYMIGGLIYTVPILLEVRLSPQINYWVYGYFPELFAQQIRFGGYRPTVFMGHGLVVAFFIMMALFSAAVLWRSSKGENRGRYLASIAWLAVVLILCKTVGAVVFVCLFAPIVLFAGAMIKRWAILCCALFVLSYPVLRAAEAIPIDQLLSYAAMIQEERAQSLGYRFENEKQLLEHASQKPIAGWGYWDRNRVFHPETGQDLTVPDGYWVIVIGVLGWVGYICVFGMLTYPLIKMWWKRQQSTGTGDDHIVLGIALMLSVNIVDLIPNSTINYFTWMIAGMLLSYVLQTSPSEEENKQETALELAPKPRRHERQPRGPRPEIDVAQVKFHRKKRSEKT